MKVYGSGFKTVLFEFKYKYDEFGVCFHTGKILKTLDFSKFINDIEEGNYAIYEQEGRNDLISTYIEYSPDSRGGILTFSTNDLDNKKYKSGECSETRFNIKIYDRDFLQEFIDDFRTMLDESLKVLT